MADLISIDINVKSNANVVTTDLDRLGKKIEEVKSRTTRYVGAAQNMANANRELSRTQLEVVRGLNQYGEVFNGTGRNLNRFNMQLQQVGYQVGDFAVQVQGGTNALVALGQQGSQLLSVFGGAAGALAGAGLAIGTSLLIPLIKASGATRTFSEALEEAQDAADAFSDSLDKVEGSFSNFTGRLEEVGRLQTAIKLLELSTAARNLNQELSEMYDGNAWLNISRAEDLANGLNLSRSGIDAVIGGLNNLKSAGSLEEQAKAATDLRIAFENSVPSINNMTSAQFEYYQKLLQTEEAMIRLADVQDRQLSKYDDQLGSEEALAAAVEANNQLYQDRLNKMQAIADTYIDILGSEAGLMAAEKARKALTEVGDSGYLGGRGGDPRKFTNTDEFRKQLDKATASTKKLKKGLSDAEKAALKLREELESPMVRAVESVSDAFGDFIARGLTDFKGFVKSILGSFQNMISQMIAMAVKNRIMLSLGIGGVTPAAAAAGQVAGLGSAATMLGSIGTGTGLAGIAGGTGFLGGAANTVAGLAGGGAGFFSIGANAAAAGGGFMATLGAAVPVLAAAALVFAFFKKKVTELDNGLQGTITTLDATIESFRTLKTTRFFGLLKKVSTETQALDQEAAGPLIESIQNIQKGVMDAAGAFGIASDVFDNFFYDFKVSLKGLSEEQKIQAVNEELTKMGDAFAALTGHFETMNELLQAANQRMELQNRLDQLLGNNAAILARQREAELAAMHELNRPLAQAIYDLEDAQFAVQNAFASLRASIDKVVSDLQTKLTVANEAVNRSRSIVSQLESALSGRYVSGDISTTMFRRGGAISYLRGGDFSDEEKLKEALSVVGEPTEGLYGSFEDYARDFYTTSAIISDAKKVAETQLSADEQQVALLEKQIADAENQYQLMLDQYNTLLGIETGVMTIGEAILQLNTTMQALMAAQAAAKAAADAKATAGNTGGSFAQQFGTGEKSKGGYDLAALRGSADLLKAASMLGVSTSGKTGAQIQQELANTSRMAVRLDKATRAQQFAMGGFHTGGVRMVGERGPELEATGPSRIFSHNQTASMFRDPDLKDAVRSLKEEVAGLRTEQRQIQMDISKYTKRSYDIERKWDVEGLPATRV